jgi:hypothetical protein
MNVGNNDIQFEIYQKLSHSRSIKFFFVKSLKPSFMSLVSAHYSPLQQYYSSLHFFHVFLGFVFLLCFEYKFSNINNYIVMMKHFIIILCHDDNYDIL